MEALGALGVAVNILTVVDLAAKVAPLCLEYAKNVKHATQVINQLHSEVHGLELVCTNLQDIISGPHQPHLKVTKELESAITDGESQLKQLQDKLRDKTAQRSRGKQVMLSLKWPFEKKGFEKHIQDLERCTRIISKALQIDTAVVVFKTSDATFFNQLQTAEGASFDSFAEQHNSYCLDNTRVKLRQEITDWAVGATAKPIFWLNGMAGTGKSTISRTVARSLAESGYLGASFFFKKGEAGRGNLSKFFVTIAADLATRKPALAPHIKDCLDADSSILTKNATEQFDKLLLQPLLKTTVGGHCSPMVFVVDALDECEPETDIHLLLRLLGRFKTEMPRQIRIFLTSRPEQPIRCGFKKIQDTYQDAILHEMPDVQHDILLLLEHELAKIREDYNSSGSGTDLPMDWPSPGELDALLKMADPLFIAATTICRFISEGRIGTPRKQLKAVLSRSADELSHLDGIYRTVLDSTIAGISVQLQERIIDEFRRVIGALILLATPLSTSVLAKLLDMTREDAAGRLSGLYSVLNIPPSPTAPVRLLHLSFREFLLNPGEPTMPFHIQEKQTHADLAVKCLRIASCLKKDICDLRYPGTLASSIGAKEIESSLPPEMQYACQYWVYHLEQSDINISGITDVYNFLSVHFLHWIEALALLGKASESPGLLKKLQVRLERLNSPEILLFLDDAVQFLQTHLQTITLEPLQLYSSLLIFTPKNSMIRAIFEKSTDKARWICLEPQMEENWSCHLRTLEAHSFNHATAMTFSHDSTMVAAAGTNVIGIWCVDTGEYLQELQFGVCIGIPKFTSYSMKCSQARSIAFSYDSSHVAVVSETGIVQAWRVDTRKCLHRVPLFNGHQPLSVAFSDDSLPMALTADGTRIKIWRVDTGDCVRTLKSSAPVTWEASSGDLSHVASTSHNGLLKIWRVDTGECVKMSVEECYRGPVEQVVFSHDAKLVAGASIEKGCKTVRIWRADTGQCLQRLEHLSFNTHSTFLWPITISHDSTLLASVSDGCVIKVLCIDTGECIQTIHSVSDIRTLVFSHNSAIIASGCEDNTVQVWRVDSRQYLGAKKRPGDSAQSIAFSDDSSLVTTSSWGGTIQTWCANTGMCLHTFEVAEDEHLRIYENTEDICIKVIFSPDLKLAASGYDHDTVRIWSVETGECVHEIESQMCRFALVTFSHDSALIALHSYDGTVRIWSLDTYKCMLKLDDGPPLSVMLFSYDSELVALISTDALRVCCVTTGECVQQLEGYGLRSAAGTFSRNSALAASSIYGDWIRIWTVETGECVQTLKVNRSIIVCLRFSYDSTLVAARCLDGTIQVWSVSTGECKRMITSQQGYKTFEFDRQGSHILTSVGAYRIGGSVSGDVAKYTECSGVGISENNDAITWNGKRVLWIPPEYRPNCSAVAGSTVVIGSKSGKINILKLSPDCLGG